MPSSDLTSTVRPLLAGWAASCVAANIVIGVRDASGRYPGRPKDESPALRNLRMDLPLAAGYVTTVEPGLYFIPAILNDPKRRRQYRESVNWHRVDKCVGCGGVRIEDTVLVTDNGPEVLTASIPTDW